MSEILTRSFDQPIRFAVPVSKVDAEKRRVRGVATQEIVDEHGEIVDYATVKACLPAWRGNIREMHQPIAVGKAIELICDDANQSVIVEAHISKGAPDTWEKVLDGTLSMYSIGGTGDRVTQKSSDGAIESRIYMKKLNEISLVDAGACPTAVFEIVKLDTMPKQSTEPVAKRLWEGYDVQNGLAVISLLQTLVQSEIEDVAFAGDGGDADAAGQLALLRSAAELVLDFVVSEFGSQFEALDALLARDADMALKFGAALEPVLKRGARNSKADMGVIQRMHDSAVTLGAACGDKDMKKQIETPVVEESKVEASVVEKAAEAPIVEEKTEPIVEASVEKAIEPMAQVVTSEPIDITKILATALPDAIAKALEPITAAISASEQAVTEKVTTAVTDLTSRVEKLEAQPMPGGPVKQAVSGTPVEKTLGGAQGDQATPTVEELLASLDPSTFTADERGTVAKLLIAAAQRGVGRVPLGPRV